MAPLVTHVTCIREVPGLNIDRFMNCIYQVFLLFSTVLRAERWDVCSRCATINPILILHSLFTNLPMIRRDKMLLIKGVV